VSCTITNPQRSTQSRAVRSKSRGTIHRAHPVRRAPDLRSHRHPAQNVSDERRFTSPKNLNQHQPQLAVPPSTSPKPSFRTKQPDFFLPIRSPQVGRVVQRGICVRLQARVLSTSATLVRATVCRGVSTAVPIRCAAHRTSVLTANPIKTHPRSDTSSARRISTPTPPKTRHSARSNPTSSSRFASRESLGCAARNLLFASLSRC
jgi:hypothetical protein